LPSDLVAAFLQAQFEQADRIAAERMRRWLTYHAAFEALEADGVLRRPSVPTHCRHNGHLYYLLLPSLAARTSALASLRAAGIDAVFHYVPLHSSPAGRRFGRASGDLRVTTETSDRLIRLPLWFGMTDAQTESVIDGVRQAMRVALR
jgi:dTDP-4-amino-4,6-dideoxygalactose transaminase